MDDKLVYDLQAPHGGTYNVYLRDDGKFEIYFDDNPAQAEYSLTEDDVPLFETLTAAKKWVKNMIVQDLDCR